MAHGMSDAQGFKEKYLHGANDNDADDAPDYSHGTVVSMGEDYGSDKKTIPLSIRHGEPPKPKKSDSKGGVSPMPSPPVSRIHLHPKHASKFHIGQKVKLHVTAADDGDDNGE